MNVHKWTVQYKGYANTAKQKRQKDKKGHWPNWLGCHQTESVSGTSRQKPYYGSSQKPIQRVAMPCLLLVAAGGIKPLSIDN